MLLLAGGAIALMSKKEEKNGNNNTNLPPTKYDRPMFDGKPTTYIKAVYPYALQAHNQYPKVPVELIIAQSGLESGWGKAAVGNNFFGVKVGKGWLGDKQLITTFEVLARNTGYNFPEVISVTPTATGKYRWKVKDYFRKYESPAGSFLDYCKLITSGRYADDYASNDVEKIIAEIKKDGYATDPNYVSKVSNLAKMVRNVIKVA